MLDKMNPEAKRLWVDALRSGDYEQARKEFYNSIEDKHCCLAVLTDVAIHQGVKGVRKRLTADGAVVYEVASISTDGLPAALTPDELDHFDQLDPDQIVWGDPEGPGGELPLPVVYWSGVSSTDPILKVEQCGAKVTAIECNDDWDYTFAQIAELIEKNL